MISPGGDLEKGSELMGRKPRSKDSLSSIKNSGLPEVSIKNVHANISQIESKGFSSNPCFFNSVPDQSPCSFPQSKLCFSPP